jgi:acyl transferase domain-containing protein
LRRVTRGAGGRRKIAGVSSFGISGTNAASSLVAEAPCRSKEDGQATTCRRTAAAALHPFCARRRGAGRVCIRSYCDFLATHSELDLGDLTYTSHVGRSHFSHRLSVTAGSVAELREKLVAAGTGAMGIQRGVVAAQQGTPQIAFLFTGQGAQYSGMGRELYRDRAVLPRRPSSAATALLDGQMGASLLEVLGYAPAAETAVSSHRPHREHPSGWRLFALEYALAQLWRSWGIRAGDSSWATALGELAAACVAGVFSLEDGLTPGGRRGQLMGALPQEGEMVPRLAAEPRLREAIVEPYPDKLSIACHQRPGSAWCSQAARDCGGWPSAHCLAAEGVKSQRLTVSLRLPLPAHGASAGGIPSGGRAHRLPTSAVLPVWSRT